MRRGLMKMLSLIVGALAIGLSACAPSETETAAPSAAPVAPPPVETDYDDAKTPVAAPELSVSGGALSAAGATDSMVVATIGAISRLRDGAAIKTLAEDAFRAADANKDGAMSFAEFDRALDFVANREAIGAALVGGDATSRGAPRRKAFETAGRRAETISADQFRGFFDLKRAEADGDFDGKLDDTEYATFAALINGLDRAD